MSASHGEIPLLEDDGLFTPEVGDWAEDKYRLVKLYASLFTTSMRHKWDQLVYIDLFAGAGRAKIRGTERILPASPLLALNVEPRFDRYVFCEADGERMQALEQRVRKDFANVDVRFVRGDVNGNVVAVVAELPRVAHGLKVLSFCFVDPFNLSNLRFDTISALAERYMDFLVLIPSGMDAHRNEGIYLDPSNESVDLFIGRGDWRQEWEVEKARGRPFERFVTDSFGRSMERLGYIYDEMDSPQLVRSTEKRTPLYRLALFSRHPLGAKFWKEVRKYAPPQRGLFD